MKERRLDNPIVVPGFLSFLAYGTFHATCRPGRFPRETWPDNIELLYYAFHMMAGLGTLFIAVMAIAALLLLAGRLTRAARMLWIADAGLSVSRTSPPPPAG